MTEHLCSTHDPTCWRCELRQDEYRRGMEEEVTELRAVVDALLERPFRGTPAERRDRLYGSDWGPVHDALEAWEGVARTEETLRHAEQ